MRSSTILLIISAAAIPAAALGFPTFISAHGRRGRDFSCPPPMSYSPWVKSCSCPPGQSWDAEKKTCKGNKMTGAWSEPSVDTSSSRVGDTDLGTFCAKSPTKITRYDPDHEYCQASVDTITFSASSSITDELQSLSGDIDVEGGGVSKELKNVCAGLSGLYLEAVDDAVALFNTKEFGLETLLRDVSEDLPSGIIDTVRRLTCLAGMGDCKHDCVSYCTKGCENHLDVVGGIGDLLEGLNGLCILDGVLETVNSVGNVVDSVVDDLLCVVGNVAEELLSMFDCECDEGDQ